MCRTYVHETLEISPKRVILAKWPIWRVSVQGFIPFWGNALQRIRLFVLSARLKTPGQTRVGRRHLRVSAWREGARNAACPLEAGGTYRRGTIRNWASRSFLPSPTIRSRVSVSQEERGEQ